MQHNENKPTYTKIQLIEIQYKIYTKIQHIEKSSI